MPRAFSQDRRNLLTALTLGAASVLAPSLPAFGGSGAGYDDDAVVAALNRGARPLRSTAPGGGPADLDPLGRMIGDVPVVGLGEATHGSHEFFTLKQRVFEYLVEHKGFTTFMQELTWGTGLLLNDYVRYGKGNPREIMLREFVQAYELFAVEEYLHLIEWMRDYNVRHPHRRQLQYMGDDVYYPHVRIFDDIFRYVQQRGHADLIPRLIRLYDGLIPRTDLATWEHEYDAKPQPERRQLAHRAEQALRLVKGLRSPSCARAADWAEQQATVALWVARTHATADFSTPRDHAMALNTVWWYRHMDSKILLSAHNAHVGYLGEFPPHTYKRQGTWLREILGPRYLAIGLSFYEGAFNAFDARDSVLRGFTVGPPPAVNAERVLNRVRFPDYFLDMRTVDQPARAWIDRQHQVRYIVAEYSPTAVAQNNIEQSLGDTYSVLIELRRVGAARLLPGVGGGRPVPA